MNKKKNITFLWLQFRLSPRILFLFYIFIGLAFLIPFLLLLPSFCTSLVYIAFQTVSNDSFLCVINIATASSLNQPEKVLCFPLKCPWIWMHALPIELSSRNLFIYQKLTRLRKCPSFNVDRNSLSM